MNRNGSVTSGQETSLPERFTWPFRYFPHRTVREAAARLTGHIDSDGRLKEIFSEGKMLGVLVVRAGKASGASSGKDRHGMQADRNLLHRLPGNSPLCGEDDIFYDTDTDDDLPDDDLEDLVVIDVDDEEANS